MAGKMHEHLTSEHLIEALEQSRGFIHAAIRYIKANFGYTVCYSTIKNRIEDWGMKDWLDDLRRELVDECLHKTFAKGVRDGDNTCIMWILEKYLHHVDFLGSKDTETQSKKGWKELLEHVKANTESDTEEEFDREHGET